MNRWLKSIIEVFILNKPLWYIQKTNNKEEESAKLDSFFNAVASLMSNQIWELTEKLLGQFEHFLSQFEHADSFFSLFKINLDISSTRIRFIPPLSEIESSLISVVQELIQAMKGISRIETKLFTSLKDTALTLNSMDMDSSRVNQGHYIRLIASRNLVGATKYILNYEKYKQILTQAYDKKIEEFLELPHSLEEFEIEIKKLNAIVNDINDHPNKVWMSMLYLDCEELNNGLKEKTRSLIYKINDSVADSQRRSSQKYDSCCLKPIKS